MARTDGFMDMRFLAHARGAPWSLLRGDLSDNLNKLLGAPLRDIMGQISTKTGRLLELG